MTADSPVDSAAEHLERVAGVIREIEEHDAQRDALCRRRDECIAQAGRAGMTAGQISRGLGRAVSETHVRGVLARIR